MAQPSKVEMFPPKDMTRESTKPERTMSGVKSESTMVLRCKANVFDITMQGRRSFTFEHEGTYHNPRFYVAKVKFSLKLVNKTGSTGYQMYSVTAADGTTTHSSYGPIIVPNRLTDFFLEKQSLKCWVEQKLNHLPKPIK